MREINFPSSRISLEHRKINNPSKAEQVFINQILILTNFHPCSPGKASGINGWCAGKKHCIAITNPSGNADGLGLFCAQSLGNWTSGFALAMNLAIEY